MAAAPPPADSDAPTEKKWVVVPEPTKRKYTISSPPVHTKVTGLLGFGADAVGGYCREMPNFYKFNPPPEDAEVHAQPPRLTLPSFAWQPALNGRLDLRSVIGNDGHVNHLTLCPATGGIKMVSNFMVNLAWYLCSLQPAAEEKARRKGRSISPQQTPVKKMAFPRFSRIMLKPDSPLAAPNGPPMQSSALYDAVRKRRTSKKDPRNQLACVSVHHAGAPILLPKRTAAVSIPMPAPQPKLKSKPKPKSKAKAAGMSLRAAKNDVKGSRLVPLAQQVAKVVWNGQLFCYECSRINVERALRPVGLGMTLKQLAYRFQTLDPGFVKEWEKLFNPTLMNAAVLAGLTLLCPTPQAADEPGNMMKHGSIARNPAVMYLLLLDWRTGWSNGPNPPLRSFVAAMYPDNVHIAGRIIATVDAASTPENCNGLLRDLLRKSVNCQTLANYGRVPFPAAGRLERAIKTTPSWFVKHVDNPIENAVPTAATGWMIMPPRHPAGVHTAVDMCVWNVVRCLTQGWRVRVQLMPRMHLKTVRPSLKGLAFGMGANEPTSMQDNGCQFYGEQMTWWKLDRIARIETAQGRAPANFEPLFIHGSLIKAKEGLRHVFKAANASGTGPLSVRLGPCFAELCELAAARHRAISGLTIGISTYSDYVNYNGRDHEAVRAANAGHKELIETMEATAPTLSSTGLEPLASIADTIVERYGHLTPANSRKKLKRPLNPSSQGADEPPSKKRLQMQTTPVI